MDCSIGLQFRMNVWPETPIAQVRPSNLQVYVWTSGTFYAFSGHISTWSSLQTPGRKKAHLLSLYQKGKKTLPLVSAFICTECWEKVKVLILIFYSFAGLHIKYLKPFLKSCWQSSILTFRPSAASHLSVGKGLLSLSQPETHADICVNIFCCCSAPMQQEAELSS